MSWKKVFMLIGLTYLYLMGILLFLYTVERISVSPAYGERMGEVHFVAAYCTTEDAAMALTVAAGVSNDVGYRAIMASVRVPCFYATPPGLHVMFLSKAWTLRRPDGLLFQFWMASDPDHRLVWTWALVEEGQA